MKRLKLLVLGVFIFSFFTSQSQTHTYEKFNSEQSVNPFVYNMIQDKNGFLLIGTGDGLLKYDGLKFELIDEEDGLGGTIVSCSFIDSKSRVWLGHSKSGTLSVLEDEKITTIDISEHVKNKVISITEDGSGNIWIATQNEGLICYGKDGQFTNFTDEVDGYMLESIHNLGGNALALATNEGVFLIENTNVNPKFTFMDEGPYTKVFDFEKIGSSHLLCTEDDGLYKIHFDNNKFQIEQIIDEFDLSSYKLTDLEYGEYGELFITAGDALLKANIAPEGVFKVLSVMDMNEGNPMETSNLKSSFVDQEKTLWIASFGDGMFKLSDNYFTSYHLPENPEIYGLSTFDNRIKVCSRGKVFCFSEVAELSVLNEEQGVPDDAILCIDKDNKGCEWLGTESNGLFFKPHNEDKFVAFPLHDDINAKRINCLTFSDKKVYVGSSYGLFVIDIENGSFEWLNSKILGHNVINDLYRDSNGKIWVSTLGQELIYFEDDQINFRKISENKRMLIETKAVAEDSNGNIWIATGTQGVVKLGEKGEENIQFTKSFGLFSSSTYGITCDKNGKIWVTHRDGLSKIDPETDEVEVYNYKNGITQDFSNAITCDSEENIWFGSNDGLVRYDPDLDKENESEPKIVFTKLMVSDSLRSTADIWDLEYGKHKIDIEFIGVSLAAGEGVTYQYYLEGYDEDWGDPTDQNRESYKPTSGEYVFKVKAFNKDGIGGEQVAEFKFSIDNPFWLKPWFIVIAVVFVLAIIRGVIYLREKQLKERQEYLEMELEARTEEVVNKNHELEEKNKDITDSINYARHIQSALIPSTELLKESLPESFVFFKPRDIVSGDFYWVKEYEKDIVIVGADCTGHGVPGAFISLIGMSIIKEISNRKDIKDPGKALNFLEVEIENTLNKNKEYGVKDGMDLGFIQMDKKSKKLWYAGARRPLLIFRGKEHFILQGDRQSIGGSYEDEPLKEFTVKEFQLQEGDRLYLWSDGYPDQFGGPNAKKLKQKGLVDIIENMQDKPMDVQYNIIRESFLTWRNGCDQIDDVLLIGIEITGSEQSI